MHNTEFVCHIGTLFLWSKGNNITCRPEAIGSKEKLYAANKCHYNYVGGQNKFIF